jgi:superoxide dismutase, Cu-Zn family
MRHLHLAAALLAWSAQAHAAPRVEGEPVRAIAVLRDGAGEQVGTATLAQDVHGVRIAIGVKGLPPGKHGFHLHAVGRCEAPDFASAGDHFNPGKKAHGPPGARSSHAGDLPELVVGADGVAQIGFIARGVSLDEGANSLLAGDGTALVLDLGPDDGRADAGGARIACGVVTRR